MGDALSQYAAMSLREFQIYLATQYVSPRTQSPLGAGASSDYASRLRRIEKLIRQPVEGASPKSLRTLADHLTDYREVVDTLSPGVISDIQVALRRYAEYLSLSPGSQSGDEGGPRTYGVEAIVSDLEGLGFSSAPPHAHVYELQRAALILYVKRQTAHQRIVVHPDFELSYSRLCAVPGVVREPVLRFYHDSSMQRFPLRQHDGTAPIPYGLDFDVVDSEALRRLVHVLEGISTGDGQAQAASPPDDPTTETRLLLKARKGQGRFRADLIEYWSGSCPLTGIRIPELLRASHIKPWSESTHRERLDPFNGLLLAVHFDTLFDQGFISFTDGGELLLAGALGAAEREVFGLEGELPRLSVDPRHVIYLAHHREHVFLGT